MTDVLFSLGGQLSESISNANRKKGRRRRKNKMKISLRAVCCLLTRQWHLSGNGCKRFVIARYHGSDLVHADVAQSNRRRVTCIFYHEYNFMHYSWRRSRVVGISIQTLQWKLKRFDSGKMNFRFNLFAVSVLALYLIANPADSTSSISINNNAYSNIVVAISPDVPNTWSETILKNIQVIYIN